MNRIEIYTRRNIHTVEEIKNIEKKEKHYTAKKIDGIQKEFIIDTGSPVTIMPFDEQIMKQTELQKTTNRYQYNNENEVKFRGKIPKNIECEINKQKMETLITERTETTPFSGMDSTKRFKLTIGKFQLAEINQSEKKNNQHILV